MAKSHRKAKQVPQQPQDPELLFVLDEVLEAVRDAHDVAATAAMALASPPPDRIREWAPCVSTSLRQGCADALKIQLKKLERAIEGAAIHGDKMVVSEGKIRGKIVMGGYRP